MGYKLSASYERMRGFYSLPKNTIDIVFIGTSHFYYGIIPMMLWEKYGITAYVLAQQTQIMECSYYYIKEALKYQSPKVIVLDIYNLLWEDFRPTIGAIRKSVDYMKWGSNKLKLIQEIIDDEYMYEYFNNYLKHDTSKYVETTYEDLYNNGEFITGEIYSIFMLDKFERFRTKYEISIRKENVKDLRIKIEIREEIISHLKHIIRELQDNNTKLLCVNMPYVLSPEHWWELEKLSDFLKEQNIHFVDFNQDSDKWDINLEMDFTDREHLDYMGAKKVTEYIGQYIMDNCQIEFEDKRNNPKYKVWNAYNKEYRETNDAIIQNLLKQKMYIKQYDSVNTEFEENFNRYVQNNIDIRLFYSKIKQNDSDINMELVKLDNEKDYVLKLDYKLGANDYVLLRRLLLNKNMYDWSNKKGIELEIIPDNSNRDLIVQIICNSDIYNNDVYIRKMIRLDGNDSKHLKIPFTDLEKPSHISAEFNYSYLKFFEIGVSTQWNGNEGCGSVIIKFIKLF